VNGATLDAAFRDAVTAIDAGDVAKLKGLIDANPALVRERLESPGQWLRDQVGGALDGFFQRPYLLWFVAEDPVRNGTLPTNIADVARAIIDAARREAASSLQEQLDYALTLVSWSWIARERGVQIELIDALVDAGAHLGGNPNNALVNGNVAAAEHLVKRGAPLTLATALCLGRWDDVDRLLESATDEQKRFSFVLSALTGNAAALRRMIAAGVDPNAPSENLYSHGTPLHHAVCSGSLEAVRVLVEAGADRSATDAAWNGTPLGWAEYYVDDAKTDDKRKQYRVIAEYLRT
jgi:peptide-methionine (S)-S-oxide reductase